MSQRRCPKTRTSTKLELEARVLGGCPICGFGMLCRFDQSCLPDAAGPRWTVRIVCLVLVMLAATLSPASIQEGEEEDDEVACLRFSTDSESDAS